MISNKPIPSRLFYVDALRALSIIAVIVLHNCVGYGNQYNQISLSFWWTDVVYNGLVRFSVPMFVLLSGIVLLKPYKEVLIKETFQKRLPKLVVPLFFWSGIYLLLQMYLKGDSWKSFNFYGFIKTFYQGPVIYHFWFLYMMIGIYLIHPIIQLFINAAEEIHIQYFLYVWIFCNSILSIINIIFNWNCGLELNSFTGYIGYFILGYYLNSKTFQPIQLRIAYCLCIIGFLLSVFTPLICRITHFNNWSFLTENDFTIDIVLVVIGLFLWVKQYFLEVSSNLFTRVVQQISKESFGIYLVHVLFMELIIDDGQLVDKLIANWHPVYLIPLKAFITLSFSFGLVKIIRLIPTLRNIIG